MHSFKSKDKISVTAVYLRFLDKRWAVNYKKIIHQYLVLILSKPSLALITALQILGILSKTFWKNLVAPSQVLF